MTNNSKHTTQKKSNTYKTAGIIILILVIIAAALFIFKSCSGDTETLADPTPTGTFELDPGAVNGGWDEADTDAIVNSLNEKVEEGMINISMNTSPVFQTGASSGNLMIVNEGINRYPQVVEIVRNDTNETVYTSGGIAVGSKIENAKLSVDLDAGTYECTALFYNVDAETSARLGCAGAVITITILE